jgi:hypothetical protein
LQVPQPVGVAAVQRVPLVGATFHELIFRHAQHEQLLAERARRRVRVEEVDQRVPIRRERR